MSSHPGINPEPLRDSPPLRRPLRSGRWRMSAAIIAILLAAGIAIFVLFSRERAPSQVTRGEALALAQRYVDHEWIPTEANLFHGTDASGIRVDTPDAAFTSNGKERGWWIPGQRNVGVPYQWGGFSTPEDFDRGLREGKYAGDVYTAAKRRLLDAGVTNSAVGVDCSGFVSRCWRLPRSYSTRELPQLCRPVKPPAELQPGDIFNRHNAHVQLFAGWADPERTTARVYEAKARVQISEVPVQQILAEGYSMWRYRGMRD